MQRLAVQCFAAIAAVFVLISLPACGGSGTSTNNVVKTLSLSPSILSLNQGSVATLSVTAQNSAGVTVAADVTFSSSNPNIATVSSGGLVCGGVWDANIINCNATLGPSGVGQVTITATATQYNVSTTATVYVHETVDQVQVVVGSNCTTMGQAVNIAGAAFSTSAPGCSPASPCNISSTVGPFNFGSNDTTIAASSAGVEPSYSSVTNSPTYTSGGTITGSSGQTCNLSDFNGVTGATATVALTGSNTIASGTHLTVTNSGYGGTVPPTTATLTSGTANCSGTADVVTALTPGVLTARTPGATTVFASVSGVNSVGVSYLTCPVASIVVHDASSSNTSFTLNPQGTQALTADVYDSNGNYIMPVLNWGSSSTAVAGVATGTSGNNPATVTAVTGGTAYITASCNYPNCNKFVPAEYSQNVATINVTTPGSTTVYAANTNSTSLVPISTATNTAGTTITLPFVPNSIMPDPSGTYVYLGSATGLMAVNVSTGAVITYGAAGSVVAISPDSNYVLLSNSSTGAITYVQINPATVTGTAAGPTSSSAFTPDSLVNEWVNGTLLFSGPQTNVSSSVAIANTANTMDISAQGGLTYITSAAGGQIYVYSTCNQALTPQTLAAAAPTLVKALPNGTGAVAADSPNIDLVATPTPVGPGCTALAAQSTINSYNLNAGSFTAQQLFVSPDASRAWIVTNLPQLLSFDVTNLTASSVPLANGAVAYNGGVTADGHAVWVGTSDTTVHGINVELLQDALQIPVNLKDVNGNLTVPNLVAVVP